MTQQLAFGACEAERSRRDKQKKLFEDWGAASEQGAGLGTIVGGCIAGLFTLNPIVIIIAAAGGGLVGGGTPGAVALRMKALLDYREYTLKQCEESNKDTQMTEAERQRQAVITQQADAIGTYLAELWRRTLTEYQLKANEEMNSKINEYIDGDWDTSDPGVKARLDAELQAIAHQYY